MSRDPHEHPVDQEIRLVQIDNIVGLGPFGEGAAYVVGTDGVTRIEACTKSGMHANIPYVRVWREDECLAEFCQHNIAGIYFDCSPEPDDITNQDAAELEAHRCKKLDIINIVGGSCTTCGKLEAECGCLPF